MRAEITRAEKGFIAVFERKLQQDAKQVWNMLADNSNLQQWFKELHMAERGRGGKLLFDKGDGTSEELWITDYEEEGVLAFEWWDDHIRFEVEPSAPGGSVLRLVKTIKQITPQTAKDLADWHVGLDMIKALMNGEDVDRDREWQHWHTEYRRLVDSMTVEFE